jgi:hypothetical protein
LVLQQKRRTIKKNKKQPAALAAVVFFPIQLPPSEGTRGNLEKPVCGGCGDGGI